MRELDQLLQPFADDGYAALSPDLQQRFREWLELPDPQLWTRLTGDIPIDPLDRLLRNSICHSRSQEF